MKQRWQEYFDKLYEVDEDNLKTLEEESHKEDDIPMTGRDEVEMAIKRLKHRKAPGVWTI